ncbi:hypothetical protein F4814DRAFT_452156 [Daldinia grandis]|nr:hypothetical protein F4814DRAFT_452156 [Daldinia grandis]
MEKEMEDLKTSFKSTQSQPDLKKKIKSIDKDLQSLKDSVKTVESNKEDMIVLTKAVTKLTEAITLLCGTKAVRPETPTLTKASSTSSSLRFYLQAVSAWLNLPQTGSTQS